MSENIIIYTVEYQTQDLGLSSGFFYFIEINYYVYCGQLNK